MQIEGIRLILADLDGTLLTDKKELDHEIKKVIQEKNIPITFVSGRNVHIMLDLVNELNVDIPYVANNGANIFLKDKCIYECSLDSRELSSCLAVLKQYNVPHLVYSNDAIYIWQHEEQLDLFVKRLQGKCALIEGEPPLDTRVFKVTIVDHDEKKMQEIMRKMNGACKESHCVRSEGDIYTLTNKKATKGYAVNYLLDKMNLNKNQVLVFGDNYNDVSMFEEVTYSVAMDNALAGIKSKARYTTLSNNENGVSSFIKKYVQKAD